MSELSRDDLASPDTYYDAARGPVSPRPSLSGTVHAPTCIIGGGLAGLATALSLAERGHRPLLLEARRVGAGASGRNGGIASAGFARSTDDLARRLGAGPARALFQLSREGLELVRQRIARYAIPCGPVPGVVVASWFDDPGLLAEEAHRHNELYGMRLEHWSETRLRETFRSPRYHGGLFDPEGFHLDPLRLCEGYAAAAEKLGARIHEGTPALALERRPDGFHIRTPRGGVTADRVILCQSVYPPPLHPPLARAGLAVVSYIIVTEPLGELAASAIRAPYAVYDDRFATGYYRLLQDGRLLWGGRVALTEQPRALLPLMRRDLATVFPQLADLRIDHAWSGRMGFARHKMPLIRELEPGLWTATLFGGHGLNTTTMAGELVARAILEADRSWHLLDPFRPSWTGGPAGRLAAQALFHGHAFKDSLRAAWLRRQRKAMPAARHPASQDQGG